MNEFIAIALITCLAVISPGADFAIITRNSYLYGRKIGIFTAFGIACGVWIHVAYCIISIHFLQKQIPNILVIIQYLVALYLIYLGYSTYFQPQINVLENDSAISDLQAFRLGLFTNALNPKTTLFIMSLFTQLIISAENSFITLIGYGAFISASHLIWFTLISIFCSITSLRNKILDHQTLINRIIGCILFILGCSLLLMKFNVK